MLDCFDPNQLKPAKCYDSSRRRRLQSWQFFHLAEENCKDDPSAPVSHPAAPDFLEEKKQLYTALQKTLKNLTPEINNEFEMHNFQTYIKVRKAVKYYFAEIRNPLFAENFVRKGGGYPPNM